jgi:hypothetical protein
MEQMASVYELDNEQAYEAEVSQCIGVTGYHRWFFLSAMAKALNLKFRAFAVESSGERLGVVPMLFRRRGPVSMVNFLPIGCIGPLLRGEALRAGRARELVQAVEPVLRGQRSVVTRWAFSPEQRLSTEVLAMPGFRVFEEENYIIPATKSVDDCWKSMSQLRRRSIRKCEARNISVIPSLPEEIKSWLPKEIRGVYSRQEKIIGYTSAEAQMISEGLAADPRMLWRTVKSADDEILGMSGCIIGEDRLDNWLMVGPPVPGISAHTAAYWDLINWSRSHGLTFDTGGAPTAGVRQFKNSIGAELETATVAIRMRPEIVYKVGRAVYNWAAIRFGK